MLDKILGQTLMICYTWVSILFTFAVMVLRLKLQLKFFSKSTFFPMLFRSTTSATAAVATALRRDPNRRQIWQDLRVPSRWILTRCLCFKTSSLTLKQKKLCVFVQGEHFEGLSNNYRCPPWSTLAVWWIYPQILDQWQVLWMCRDHNL